MYRIIGGDQQEYGPASEEQVKRWIKDGRANEHTLTQRDGETEWRPLAEFSEFAELFNVPSGTEGTPASGDSPSVTNGMSIAGLVMGILGLSCCGFGPVFSALGIVFSAIGLNQINTFPHWYKGRGLAIAGLILSILGLATFLILAITGNLSIVVEKLEQLQERP